MSKVVIEQVFAHVCVVTGEVNRWMAYGEAKLGSIAAARTHLLLALKYMDLLDQNATTIHTLRASDKAWALKPEEVLQVGDLVSDDGEVFTRVVANSPLVGQPAGGVPSAWRAGMVKR